MILGARGCVTFWVRVGLVAKNGLAVAVRRVSTMFLGFLFRRRFRQYEEDLFKLPFSSFHVFLFSAFSFWVWGPCTMHPYFWALGPKPSLFFLSFLVLFRKHCFP